MPESEANKKNQMNFENDLYNSIKDLHFYTQSVFVHLQADNPFQHGKNHTGENRLFATTMKNKIE